MEMEEADRPMGSGRTIAGPPKPRLILKMRGRTAFFEERGENVIQCLAELESGFTRKYVVII